MLSQMNQLGSANKAILLYSRHNSKILKLRKCIGNGTQLHSLSTTTDASPESNPTYEDHSNSSKKPIDNTVRLQLMRKNLTGPGLKLSANRFLLTKDIFSLTEAISQKKLRIEDFLASSTFQDLQEKVECNIDMMSNAQLIRLLSGVVKLGIDSSNNLMRLLEHEVKFRLSKMSLDHIIKLSKIYDSIEIISDQKQIVDTLNYTLRAKLQKSKLSIKEFNSILHLISKQQLPNSLIGIIEEKLLAMLALDLEDYMIDRFLNHERDIYDYSSLCTLFIRLADNGRRPTPLLKAASIALSRIIDPIGNQCPLIIATLKALVELNYRNKMIITKLMNDLKKTINFEELDNGQMSDLFASIGNFRWRDEELFNSFVDFNRSGTETVDHRVILSFLYTSSIINYRHPNMDQYYSEHLKSKYENCFSDNPRIWLKYIWSLAALRLVDRSHLNSVLNKNHIELLKKTAGDRLTLVDTKRLLNLQAIASHEFGIQDTIYDDELKLITTISQRGVAMQKLATKVQQAIESMTDSPESHFRRDIETPFGFNIDFEMHLSETLEPIPLNNSPTSFDVRPADSDCKKCAIVLVSYDETIANSNTNEVVGQKIMVSRILKSFGYETAFISENSFHHEVSDLVNDIKTIMRNSFLNRLESDC